MKSPRATVIEHDDGAPVRLPLADVDAVEWENLDVGRTVFAIIGVTVITAGVALAVAIAVLAVLLVNNSGAEPAPSAPGDGSDWCLLCG